MLSLCAESLACFTFETWTNIEEDGMNVETGCEYDLLGGSKQRS
jgi:hypothetical protein